MKVADIHVHTNAHNFKEAIRFLDDIYDEGVRKVATQSEACFHFYGNFQNVYCLWLKEIYKKMDVYAFGSLHEVLPFSDIPYEKQLEALIEAGCDGIKFLQEKPNIRKFYNKGLSDSSYDKMFSIMEEIGLPALIHSKDPKYFWDRSKMLPMQIERGWCYDADGFLTYEELHKETLKVMEKHPKLKVILAHFFFMEDDIKEAERIMNEYPNVYFDLTPHADMFIGFSKDIDAWQEFFTKYQDRILFGTDVDDRKDRFSEDGIYDVYNLVKTALIEDKNDKDIHCYWDFKIKGLNLTKDVVEKITYKNFVNLLGEKPKSLNKDILKKMTEYAIKELEKASEYEDLKLFKDFLKNFN